VAISTVFDRSSCFFQLLIVLVALTLLIFVCVPHFFRVFRDAGKHLRRVLPPNDLQSQLNGVSIPKALDNNYWINQIDISRDFGLVRIEEFVKLWELLNDVSSC
jgi:hypothetical protein